MSAAAPWSVKGIDPKAREIAKDLARRSGLTLGEWLNTMILDEDEDEGVVPLSRRPHAADLYERRGRSRRMDDAYPAEDDTLQRMAASVETIAARLEASERRATIAIQGVDQAVAGLVRRLDAQDGNLSTHGRRIDDIAEELREGHRRLRRFEQEVGPQTAESFKRTETSVAGLASRLYDIEERQRTGMNELRGQIEAAQGRLELRWTGTMGGEELERLRARLDQAQEKTGDALRALEASFARLDQRLSAAETRVVPEGAREAARFEKLAETLSRQVADSREEMLRRLETAQHESRLDRIERAVEQVGDQARAAEARSAGAVEAMGRELLNIARNLNGRMERVERAGDEGLKTLQAELGARLERDSRRVAETLERRLTLADDRHALAIEKLGGEVSRISERLSERISVSERRSAQALDEIGERLARTTDRIEHRYDRASGELAERMRLSEERTARLLADAKRSIEARDIDRHAGAPVAPMLLSPESLGPPPIPPSPDGDWRAAAFPETFEGEDSWAAGTRPFPTVTAEAAPEAAEPAEPVMRPVSGFGRPDEAPPPVFLTPPAFEPAAAEAAWAESEAEPHAPAFGGFGGAEVRDVLVATEAVARDPHDDAGEPFAAETEFVDPRQIRRASSAREALDAARAAMTAADAKPARASFGLKRGGKSRLQERLDKQARNDGSIVGKTLVASVTAVAVTSSIIWGYNNLSGRVGAPVPAADGQETAPLALALTPAPAVPAEVERLYDEAAAAVEGGDEAAVADITEAAEAGSLRAQVHLAQLYETGQGGLPADMALARQWTRRAAEGGETLAMHNLAMYLFDGDGGERDQAEAVRWFTRAARAGLTDSQYNLARMYETGAEGVPANAAQAYLWYLIAARNGDTEATTAAERIGLGLNEAARRDARAAADRFQAEPVDAVAEG
ncbi:MAG: hypothetical protein ACK57S_06060 [Brevundimonas sp.]|uniref:SEL1-like repeat protein n=1 Tax=Brevundimonas sp. TaxID=1871086 RepID=UPI00391F41BF